MFGKAIETLRGLTARRRHRMTDEAIRRSPVRVGINLSTGTRWPRPRARLRLAGGRNLRPTAHRRAWGGLDHQAPIGGRDHGGHPWRGTSRIMDPQRHRARSHDGQWRAFYRETSKARWQLDRFNGMGQPQLLAEAIKRRLDVTYPQVALQELTEQELRNLMVTQYVNVGAL